MSKSWKPAIEESAVTMRQRRVLGPRPSTGWRVPGLAVYSSDVRLMLMTGIFVGLIFAFVPNLLYRTPEPDKPIPKSVERKIIAERTRERIGDGLRPVAGNPHDSAVDYIPPDEPAWNQAKEPDLL